LPHGEPREPCGGLLAIHGAHGSILADHDQLAAALVFKGEPSSAQPKQPLSITAA